MATTLTVERSREKIALSRDAVQKKTFTKWVNSHLIKAGVVVEDLCFDLRNGRNLIILLELLTNTKLPREKGDLRFHRLQDINTVLRCLEKRKIDTINIESSDILDGNAKLTMGLVWRLILHFQISAVTYDDEGRAGPVGEVKKIILKWCKAAAQGYKGVSVDNFTTSWKDGLAFNAILNRFRPDAVDFDCLRPGNNMANLQQAFTVAENQFGVIQLLDAEDFNMAVPDENSILTYISLMIKALPDTIPPHPKYISASEVWAKYEEVAVPLLSSVDEKMGWLESSASLTDLDDLKSAVQEAGEFQQRTLPVWAASKDCAETLFCEVEQLNSGLVPPFPIKEELSFPVLEEAWSELLQALERNTELWTAALKNSEELGESAKLQQEAERLNRLLQEQSAAVLMVDEILKASEGSPDSHVRVEEITVQLETIQRDLLALEQQVNLQLPDLSQNDVMVKQIADLQMTLQKLQGQLAEHTAGLSQKSATEAEFRTTYSLHSAWLQDREESLQSAQWSADRAIAKELLEAHHKVHSEIVTRCVVVEEFCQEGAVVGEVDLDLASLQTRLVALQDDSDRRRTLLALSVDAMGLLEWIEAHLEPELTRDLATTDASEMADCQVALNDDMDSKEEEMNRVSDMFEALVTSKLPTQARKVLQGLRKAVEDKWQELENVYNSMDSNIEIVERYQEAKIKVEDCADRMKKAQELLHTASAEPSDTRLAEVDDALLTISGFAEDLAALVADVSPLHRRFEPAPKKYFVHAVSTMNIGKRTLTHTEECLLIDNSDRRYWKVATTAGSFIVLPSPLLMFPPPAHDLLATLQSVDTDVSECRDQLQTIRKQRDVDIKKTEFLSEAEYIMSLKVDESFDCMVESREDLLERCRQMLPGLLAEGDTMAVERFQAAEQHWQALCRDHAQDKVAPYLEFMRWLCDKERLLVGQSDLPRSLQAIRATNQQPIVTLATEIDDQGTRCEVLEQLKVAHAGDAELCGKVDTALERYAVAAESCRARRDHLETVVAGLSAYDGDYQSRVAWLDATESGAGRIDHSDIGHDGLREQLELCKVMQSNAENEEQKFTDYFAAGEATSDQAQAWQAVLTAYLESLKRICSPAELQEISSGVDEEPEESGALMIDEIPDELVVVSERYEALLMTLKREEKRLSQQLSKSGRVHDLLDEVAAWLKESERIALQESAEPVKASLDEIESHLDVLDELESGAQVQDALMMQALAAYEDFVDSSVGDMTDKPAMVTALNDRLQTFRKAAGQRKQALRDMHELTEVFERQCTEQLYWLSTMEAAAKHQQPPSLTFSQLEEQIKQHITFMEALGAKQPAVAKVKTSGEALLSNPAISAASKEVHRAQLTEVLSCNGHLLLQSSARQKQLDTVRNNLKAFTDHVQPSAQWIGDFEERLCVDGAPAVDAPVLKKQTDRVEAHHRSLQEQSKQLAEVLASGQRVLLTLYMTASSRVTVTHTLKETDAETGGVLHQESVRQESERAALEHSEATLVGGGDGDTTGTLNLGELPSERFVVKRRSGGDEPDSAVRVDVLKMAEAAVADDSASWVQRECVELPKRFQAAGQSCVVRIRELATMKAHVDNFDSSFEPLLSWLEDFKTKADDLKVGAGCSDTLPPDVLQQQLENIKVYLRGLSEQSLRVVGVLESGRGILDKHNVALDALKEQVAKLSAARGEAAASAAALDKETAPGVIALQDKLDRLQWLWDDLNALLQSKNAELEATLTASKDLSEAVEGLAQDISQVARLTAALKLLAADKPELAQQMEDLKAITRRLATVRTKLNTLTTSSASSPALQRSLGKMEQDCQEVEAKLNKREKAISGCRSFLESVDDVQPWLSEKEAYIAALPSSNTALLKAFVLDVKLDGSRVSSVSGKASSLAEDFAGHVDRAKYEQVSKALEAQFEALNVAVGEGFKTSVVKIHRESQACQEEVNTLVGLPMPVSSGGLQHRFEKATDAGRSVAAMEQSLQSVSLALDDLAGQGVADTVLLPAGDKVAGIQERLSATKASIAHSQAMLTSATSMAVAFESSHAETSSWLTTNEDTLSLLSDEIGDDNSELKQQVEELKEFVETVEAQQTDMSHFQTCGKDLVDFGRAQKASEKDVTQVAESLQKAEARYTKLLQDSQASLVDVEAQLGNVEDFEQQAQALTDWLDKQADQLTEFPDSGDGADAVAVFESKLQALEAISDGLAGHEADKGALWKASLRIAEGKKRGRVAKSQASGVVGERASHLEQKWSDVVSLLEKQRQELDVALKRVSSTTGDVAQLEKWLQSAKARTDGLPLCACVPKMVDDQLAELERVRSEVQGGSSLLADAEAKCSELSAGDALRTRLTAAQGLYDEMKDALETKELEYQTGKEDAQTFASESAKALENLSEIAEVSSSYLVQQPPSSLDALRSELQAVDALTLRLAAEQSQVPVILELGSALCRPVVGVARQGNALVLARQDELRNLLDQIIKDIDAQQKHLEDALRVATVFCSKCEEVEGPFAEMEQLLLAQQNGHSNLQAQSASIIQELATKEPNIQAIQQAAEDLKNVCDPDDHDSIDAKVESVMTRWHQLQREAMQRLGEMETAAKYAIGFQEKLEPFLEWLDDFETLERDEIGLVHKEIEAVFHDVQAMGDTLTLQKAELQDLWMAAEELMEQAGSASGRVQQQMDQIQSRFDKQASGVLASLDKVQQAMHAATEYEHPYKDLMNEKSGLEVSVLHPEPLTGSLEDTQRILVDTQALHGKTMVFAPQVASIHQAAERLLLLSEVDQARKDKCRDDVDDFQAAWGVLQLRAGLRVEKTRSAVKHMEVFAFDHLNPLLDWIGEVESLLGPPQPVLLGDATSLQSLREKLQAIQVEIPEREVSYSAADNCGTQLIKEFLDDPFVTEEQLVELSLRWQNIKSRVVAMDGEVAAAIAAAQQLNLQLTDTQQWLNGAQAQLSAMAPVSHVDLATVEGQLQEIVDFSKVLDRKYPEIQAVLDQGRLALATDRSGASVRSSQSDVLDEIDQLCSDLRYQSNERIVDVEASMLALRGLQDALSEMRANVDDLDSRLGESETEAISADLPGIRAQLDIVMLLQEDMHHLQPRMDVLGKALRDVMRQDRTLIDRDPQMKAISELQHDWKSLWLRVSQRQGQFEDALAHLTDAEAAKNFDYGAWRDKFVPWLDSHNVRVSNLFAWSDDTLRRDDFVAGLERYHRDHPVSRVEKSRIADLFDPNEDGKIDYWTFAASLRPERLIKFRHKPKTEAEHVDQEVRSAVSCCTCAKQFRIEQVGDARYMFGDSEMIRMVRILRTLVMVRVGGGWQNLDEFLNKHDPCRAQAHASLLKSLLKRRKLAAGSGAVKQDTMSKFVSHTQSSLHQRHSQSLAAAATDPRATVTTQQVAGNRRQTLVTKRTALEKGKERPHVIDGDSSSPRIQRSFRVETQVHAAGCSQSAKTAEYSPFRSASSGGETKSAIGTSSAASVRQSLSFNQLHESKPSRTTPIKLAPGQEDSTSSVSPAQASPRSPKLRRKSSFSKIPVPKSAGQSKIPTPTRH